AVVLCLLGLVGARAVALSQPLTTPPAAASSSLIHRPPESLAGAAKSLRGTNRLAPPGPGGPTGGRRPPQGTAPAHPPRRGLAPVAARPTACPRRRTVPGRPGQRRQVL